MSIKPVDQEKRSQFPSLYGTESVSQRIERQELERLDIEPGPGAYFGPDSQGFNALGSQRFSRFKSEPTMSFAKTGWTNWQKVFITKAHGRTGGVDEVPGPGAYREAEDLSTLNLENGVPIGIADRFPKKAYASVSPGPRYDVRGKHWIDVTTITKKNNAARFSKGDRFIKPSRSLVDLGPGQYNRKDTAIRIDPATAKSFGLGFAAYERVICPGWEKVGQGKLSSGPGPPLWRDPLNAKDVQVHAIPKGRRWPKIRANEVPGPGAYDRSEQDTSNLGCSLAQVPNPVSIKFGKPSTKPRFRQALLLRCDNAGWGYF